VATDPDDPSPESLKASARHDFPGFYRLASSDDARLMDNLLMAHAGFLIGYHAPRPDDDPALKAEVERICDAAERLFMMVREEVRQCRAFRTAPVAEQFLIQKVLFEVQGPES
jgi:hypothetical protein